LDRWRFKFVPVCRQQRRIQPARQSGCKTIGKRDPIRGFYGANAFAKIRKKYSIRIVPTIAKSARASRAVATSTALEKS
jgi:hypothetical protein